MYEFEFWRVLPLILAAPAQLAFVLVYSLKIFGAGQWWKSYVGRSIFVKSVSLSFLLNIAVALVVSRWINGQYEGVTFAMTLTNSFLDAMAVLGYWAVCFAVYYQLALLVRLRYALGS